MKNHLNRVQKLEDQQSTIATIRSITTEQLRAMSDEQLQHLRDEVEIQAEAHKAETIRKYGAGAGRRRLAAEQDWIKSLTDEELECVVKGQFYPLPPFIQAHPPQQ